MLSFYRLRSSYVFLIAICVELLRYQVILLYVEFHCSLFRIVCVAKLVYEVLLLYLAVSSGLER